MPVRLLEHLFVKRTIQTGLALVVAGVFPAILGAQARRSSGRGPAVVSIIVTDSNGARVPNAEVLVLDSAGKKVLRTIPMADQSLVTISDLPVPQYYVFHARRVGFARALSRPLRLAPGDMLDLEFVLDSLQVLPAVVVTSRDRRQYHTDERDLGRLNIDNLSLGAALGRYRKFTMGDQYRCPVRDRFDYPNVYVNGVYISPGMARTWPPFSEIFASDIQEVQYIGCWRTDMGKMRNSIIINLKPGVEYPAKRGKYGRPQKKPTRDPKPK